MEKYNIDLIKDYVEGRDIVGFDIDDLENDIDFMIQVIDYTEDKNMYYLCGDEIKNDYRLISYLVNKFRDDLPFVISIGDKFIESNDKKDDNWFELNILLSDIIGNSADSNLMKYREMANITFWQLLHAAEDYKKRNPDQSNSYPTSNLGFDFMERFYLNRPIILDFLAKKYIETIFENDNKYTFEQLIHKNAKSFEEIKAQKPKWFLIDCLNKYDETLAYYVDCFPNLLDKTIHNLDRVEKNWDNYMQVLNAKRVNIIFYELGRYFDDNEKMPPSFTYNQLIEYLIKKYNLQDVFGSNSSYNNFIKPDIEKLEVINPLSEKKLKLVDLRYIKFGCGLIEDLFKEDVIDTSETYEKSNNKVKQKSNIIKMPTKKEE